MATIYIETHGCQMNEADSQYIARRAQSAGYALCDKAEDASVLVLNTCTVRDNAERRAYGRVGSWKKLKTADPTVRVIVAGCLAEQDKDRMGDIMPHVDGIFGPKDLAKLGDALVAWRPEFTDDDLTEDRSLLVAMDSAGSLSTYDRLRAFVNVQRGCSYYCTYCIVPHVRGRFDHRAIGEIIAEVERKVAAGAREVTLVGQTVNAYKEPGSGADFADLLETVAAISGVERLAFVTSHPNDFNEKLARAFGSIPQLNPRFHLPVQTASNPVLRKMNRKYTIEEYDEKIAIFRQYAPDWALTTDIIVAFPSETEDDFQKTLAMCDDGRFAQAYMFVYSPRRGTPAAHWEQIPADVGQDRLTRLMDVIDRGVRAFHDRKVGTTVRALIHGPSRKDRTMLSAKTLDNVTVVFPTIEDPAFPLVDEPWVDVRIDSAAVWGLRGTAVRRAARFGDAGHEVRAIPQTLDLVTLAR